MRISTDDGDQMSLEMFEAVEKQSQDVPAWVADLRKPAREAFRKNGWPSRRQESWRFTGLDSVRNQNFKWAAARGPVDQDFFSTLDIKDVYRFNVFDGHFDSSVAHAADLESGVQVKSLSQAFVSDQLALANHFNEANDLNHPFRALNQAALNNGVFLQVAAGVKVDKPVHIVFYNGGRKHPFCTFPRLFIDLHEGAECNLICHHVGELGSHYLHSGEISIRLGKQASLKHTVVQNENSDSYHFSMQTTRLEEGARYKHFLANLGAKQSRIEHDVFLEGEQCSIDLDGYYLGSASQQQDFYTRVHHNKPNCQSKQIYKGIVQDQAKVVFDGLISVAKGADGTDGKQLNKNLVISSEARVHTNPQLRIDADDVKCAHGATVAQLGHDEMFYLNTRGISKARAKKLLTAGFVKEVLNELDHDEVRGRLEQQLLEWGG